MIDWYGSRLLHIINDMKMKTIQIYHEKPWYACVFRTYMLVISTKNTFDFHLWISDDRNFLSMDFHSCFCENGINENF